MKIKVKIVERMLQKVTQIKAQWKDKIEKRNFLLPHEKFVRADRDHWRKKYEHLQMALKEKEKLNKLIKSRL